MISSPESVKNFFCLNGKKAIVTGGGGGIGSVIAEGLAELGVDIALLEKTDSPEVDIVYCPRRGKSRRHQ